PPPPHGGPRYLIGPALLSFLRCGIVTLCNQVRSLYAFTPASAKSVHLSQRFQQSFQRAPWGWIWFALLVYVIWENRGDAKRYQADIWTVCTALQDGYASLPDSVAETLVDRDYMPAAYTACEEQWWLDEGEGIEPIEF
ncbi:MAG: hypothetical protein LC667_07035, partial [Thioalkalivibrio sp.]|nr:hypothetical protein [Thioalkalivibrio sp.]